MPFTNTIKEPKKTVSVLMEERYVVSRKKYLGSIKVFLFNFINSSFDR